MAKDFAFMFYPGDYLRDTQCLSEKAQVAYDRIMCEHMRNISLDMNNIAISKDKVNFFIKRLSEEEKNEIFQVLTKVSGGYQIYWVAVSISKRANYSDSRAKNRSKKKDNISSTHENTSEVMEIEDDIYSIIVKLLENTIEIDFSKNIYMIVKDMLEVWLKYKPHYQVIKEVDYSSLLQIAYHIADRKGWRRKDVVLVEPVKWNCTASWEKIVQWLTAPKNSEYYKTMPLDKVCTPKGFRDIEERMKTTDVLAESNLKKLEEQRIDQEQYLNGE